MPSGVYIRTEEIRKNMSKSHIGKHHSEETKQKISKTGTGKTRKPFSEETKRKMSEANRGMLGKHHSEITKRKMRLSAIKRIETSLGTAIPNYNIGACKIIEDYGIANGYNFQRAENGGEFYIKTLGYYVDGYDKDKNVVVKVDEQHHFDRNGNLKEKDITRQREIQNFLSCNFIRIKI